MPRGARVFSSTAAFSGSASRPLSGASPPRGPGRSRNSARPCAVRRGAGGRVDGRAFAERLPLLPPFIFTRPRLCHGTLTPAFPGSNPGTPANPTTWSHGDSAEAGLRLEYVPAQGLTPEGRVRGLLTHTDSGDCPCRERDQRAPERAERLAHSVASQRPGGREGLFARAPRDNDSLHNLLGRALAPFGARSAGSSTLVTGRARGDTSGRRAMPLLGTHDVPSPGRLPAGARPP